MTPGSEFVFQLHWPSNHVFHFQELNLTVTPFPPRPVWLGAHQLDRHASPRHHARTHPLPLETSSTGKTLAVFIVRPPSLTLSDFCVSYDTIARRLSLQRKYFTTNRQKQKKVCVSRTGSDTAQQPRGGPCRPWHCAGVDVSVSTDGPS